jgi:hypothetical protein
LFGLLGLFAWLRLSELNRLGLLSLMARLQVRFDLVRWGVLLGSSVVI